MLTAAGIDPRRRPETLEVVEIGDLPTILLRHVSELCYSFGLSSGSAQQPGRVVARSGAHGTRKRFLLRDPNS